MIQCLPVDADFQTIESILKRIALKYRIMLYINFQTIESILKR